MNIKKLFPEKRISRKGLMEFFDKKGFYIVLILCIAIVGATAVFVTTYNISSSNTGFDAEKIIPEEMDGKTVLNTDVKQPAQSAVNTQEQTVQKKEANKIAGTGGIITAANNSDKQAAGQSEAKKPAAAVNEQAKSQKFIVPVFGDVTFDYAQDKLVYSKTLEEWRTHSGLDLSADRGVQVKAVADGTISEIKNDPRFGTMIIIDHQNGIKTVYANLASGDMVAPNQRVKQGDIIGSIGNSAAFESAEQSHLHFEVWKNNTAVNPVEYLPKK